MAERVRIGAAGRPLSVLDSSGNVDPLACLFDSNYRPLRGALVKGVISVLFHMTGTVPLGTTLSSAPFFLALMYTGIFYNGAPRTETLWCDRASDSGVMRGGLARSYPDRLEFYTLDVPTVGSSALFYYAAMKNGLGS